MENNLCEPPEPKLDRRRLPAALFVGVLVCGGLWIGSLYAMWNIRPSTSLLVFVGVLSPMIAALTTIALVCSDAIALFKHRRKRHRLTPRFFVDLFLAWVFVAFGCALVAGLLLAGIFWAVT